MFEAWRFPLLLYPLKLITIFYSKQSNEKREELRKMVGRRYRDVLDASDTIRRLTDIVTDVGENMKEIRKIAKTPFSADDVHFPVKKETVLKFGLLLRLERLVCFILLF